MIDVPAALLQYIETGLGAKTPALEVYAGRVLPPEGFNLSQAQWCVCFNIRGGIADYEAPVLFPSVQFKAYGKSELFANQVDGFLYDALHLKGGGRPIAWGVVEVLGTSLREPETQWPYVLSFYQFTVING